uniref:Uncharacterized protein n=1 Tax=Arundo donax TaxID=35708 RepID=A0A0A9HQG9_ARUDO
MATAASSCWGPCRSRREPRSRSHTAAGAFLCSGRRNRWAAGLA